MNYSETERIKLVERTGLFEIRDKKVDDSIKYFIDIVIDIINTNVILNWTGKRDVHLTKKN